MTFQHLPSSIKQEYKTNALHKYSHGKYPWQTIRLNSRRALNSEQKSVVAKYLIVLVPIGRCNQSPPGLVTFSRMQFSDSTLKMHQRKIRLLSYRGNYFTDAKVGKENILS